MDRWHQDTSRPCESLRYSLGREVGQILNNKRVYSFLEVSKWLKMAYFYTFSDVTFLPRGVMTSNLFLRHASISVDVVKGSDEARSDMPR